MNAVVVPSSTLGHWWTVLTDIKNNNTTITQFQNKSKLLLPNLFSIQKDGKLAKSKKVIVRAVPVLTETPAFSNIVDE
jgi:hypothetical protein